MVKKQEIFLCKKLCNRTKIFKNTHTEKNILSQNIFSGNSTNLTKT